MKISDLIVFLENVLEHRGDIDVYIKNFEPDYDDYYIGSDLVSHGGWETTTNIKEISIEKLKDQDILTLTPNNGDYFINDGPYTVIDDEKRRYVLIDHYGQEIDKEMYDESERRRLEREEEF